MKRNEQLKTNVLFNQCGVRSDGTGSILSPLILIFFIFLASSASGSESEVIASVGDEKNEKHNELNLTSLIAVSEKGTVISSGAQPAKEAGSAFGNVISGKSLTRTFILKNAGETTVDLIGGRYTGSNFFKVKFSSVRLEPGQKHSLQVTFHPQGRGVEHSRFVVIVKDSDPFEFNFSGSDLLVEPAEGPLEGGNRLKIIGNLPWDKLNDVKMGAASADFKIGWKMPFFSNGPAPLYVTVPPGEKSGAVDLKFIISGKDAWELTDIYRYAEAQRMNE